MTRNHSRLLGPAIALLILLPATQATALTVADLNGTWNVVSFSMPSRFTLQRNARGAVTGINEADQFQSTTGSLTVQSDGTFSGDVPDPINGTLTLGARGEVIMNVNSQEGAQTMTFHVNDSGDLLATGGSFGGNSQELILAVRAPSSATGVELAGTWNISSFQTPRRLDFARNGSNEVINVNGLNAFRTQSGSLVINSNGTASGQMQDPFTATYTIANNGRVDVTVNSAEGAMPLTLFANAGKDTMVAISGADSSNDNYQELIVFQRVPASTARNELSGLWRVVAYDAPHPAEVKNGEGVVIGLNNESNFRAARQRVIVGHDGFFVAYVGDVAIGTLTPGDGGVVNVAVQNSEGAENLLFRVSAGKTIMASAFGDSSSQEMLVLTRAPAATGPTDDFGLITSRTASGLFLQWAAGTNTVLQSSADLGNWDAVTNTVGRHEYSDPGTNGPIRYYRVVQPSP